MTTELTTTTNQNDWISKLEWSLANVRNVPESEWYRIESTYPISSYGRLGPSLRLRDILTGLNEPKSWEYLEQTQALTFVLDSGQTINLARDLQLDTPIGATNTVSSTVSELSPKSGSMSGDPISPKHYQNGKGQDIIEFTEQLNFNRGNAIKYIFRAGKKNKNEELQDLKKALWYVSREIQRLGGEVGQAVPQALTGSGHLVQGPINSGWGGNH